MPSMKITDGQVREAFTRINAGELYEDVAASFGVTPTCVYVRGRKLGLRMERPRRAQRPRESRLTLPKEPADLAYVAAMIDGEGYISRWESRNTVGYRVGITNTYEPLIEWLETFGGRRGKRGDSKRSGWSDKPCYDWQVMARREVLELLVAVSPYMRIKRDKALAVIAELREAGL